MANERVRFVERSYRSILLEVEPDFYQLSNNLNRVEYKFSNGREFKGHNIYDNYTPIEES